MLPIARIASLALFLGASLGFGCAEESAAVTSQPPEPVGEVRALPEQPPSVSAPMVPTDTADLEATSRAAAPNLPATELSLPALRGRITARRDEGATEALDDMLDDMEVFVWRFADAPSSAEYRTELAARGRTVRERRAPRPRVRRTAGVGFPPPRAPAPRPIVPRVRTRRPQVRGNLDPILAHRVVRRHQMEIRHCYELTLRADPEAQGELTLGLTIAPAGNVVGAAVRTSTVAQPQMHQCVLRFVRRWRFPTSQPAGPNAVLVDFRFSTSG